MSFSTPILFLIFNRPEITQSVFEEIKKQKPKYLYVAADGARHNVVKDLEKCKATRALVLDGIDWDCEVKTLFRDKNLGCGSAVSEAITWFFDNVEQGIILEDDCLPHPSFFGFCETLLEHYKYNELVYGITGDNFQNGKVRGNYSYYFSHYFHIWGWASWRRAWDKYDFNLKQLEAFKEKKLIKKIDKRTVFKNYWISIFEKTANKEIDTWDYQWQFVIWNESGLIATPVVNLISNIGFGKEATHTIGSSPLSKMETTEMGTIIHPQNIRVNKKADRYVSDTVFKIKRNSPQNLFKKINENVRNKIKTVIAPEIIQFVKRKYNKTHYEFGVDLLNTPRYTKTNIIFRGVPFIIPDSASFLFMHKEIFKENIYKFETLRTTPYIIDGGANIGLATIYLKLLHPTSKIISFEPDPEIYGLLENNIKVFNFTDIELVQKALWNENKTILFKAEGADAGIISDVDSTISDGEQIEAISLRPYLKNTVDFLKLDIEGAETIVLKDIEGDLGMVQRIFIEYHSFVNQRQSLNEIIDILTKSNFRIYVSSPGLSSKTPLVYLNTYNNMDMQLNIYGFKNQTI